jgi:RNA recognition motif-containing protein
MPRILYIEEQLARFAYRILLGSGQTKIPPPLCAQNQSFILQILIRNIDRSITEAQLLELFRKHGKVSSLSLVLDLKTGSSKGFGFAEMPNMDEAAKAIQQLNGARCGSSVMRVKRAANSTITKHHGKNRRD